MQSKNQSTNIQSSAGFVSAAAALAGELGAEGATLGAVVQSLPPPPATIGGLTGPALWALWWIILETVTTTGGYAPLAAAQQADAHVASNGADPATGLPQLTQSQFAALMNLLFPPSQD